MAYSYEAVVSMAGREMFQDAFRRYMSNLSFDHIGVGGWLGDHVSHGFRRNDQLVSLSFSDEGQSHFRIVVYSDTVQVEQLVLDVLTEGTADFLQPFCETLSGQSSRQILESLVRGLRDAFDRVVHDEG